MFTLRLLLAAFVLLPCIATADPPPKRVKAIDMLWEAQQLIQNGHRDGVQLLEKAYHLDNDLAVANLFLGELAMHQEEWNTAHRLLQRGLKLVDGPDQLFAPAGTIQVSAKELKGDASVFLAFTLIQIAKQDFQRGDAVESNVNLMLARVYLATINSLDPGPETRAMANDLEKLLDNLLGD